MPHRLIGIAACWLFLTAGQMRPQSSAALIHKVEEHYNHLSSFQAAFTETYKGAGLDHTETGTLLLKKPGRMRWNYSKPAGKVFLFDGKYGWFYSPGDAQATRITAKQLDDLQSPLRFLLGHTKLAKELEGLNVSPEGTNFVITGTPRGMALRVKKLTLDAASDGSINQMKIEEVDGSVTNFTFEDMKENLAMPPAEFVFTLPAGVTIVDGLSPL